MKNIKKKIKKQIKELKIIQKEFSDNYQQISASGNNGGDLLDIKNLENGTLLLSVGSCCVRTIQDIIVPVEFLTGLMTQQILEHGSIESIIDTFNWPEEFLITLKEKVKKI